MDQYDPLSLAPLIKAWQRGERRLRTILIAGLVFVVIAIVVLLLSMYLSDYVAKEFAGAIASVTAVIGGLLLVGVSSYQSFSDEQARERKIEIKEERLRDHPEKPQLAWDLAREKLENYLDRNLSQVRSIYWLTLFVMLCGFAFVMYGLVQVSQDPKNLSVSLVGSASGVLISFIGGSFLLIYRSILAQSKEYVTVLERINAVGMAVQVIASIPDSNADLKNQTTAELAKLLLKLYTKLPLTSARNEPAKS